MLLTLRKISHLLNDNNRDRDHEQTTFEDGAKCKRLK